MDKAQQPWFLAFAFIALREQYYFASREGYISIKAEHQLAARNIIAFNVILWPCGYKALLSDFKAESKF